MNFPSIKKITTVFVLGLHFSQMIFADAEILTESKLTDSKLEEIAKNFTEICSTLNTDEQYCEVKRLKNIGDSAQDLRNYIMSAASDFVSDYSHVSLLSAYHPLPGSSGDRRYNKTTPLARFNGYYKEVFSALAPDDIARINKHKKSFIPYLSDKTHKISVFFNSAYWSSYDGIVVTDEQNKEALLIVSIQTE